MRSWYAAVFGLVLIVLQDLPSFAAESAVAQALCDSIDRNVAHARGWLEAGDFKSLAQTAGGLELLAAVLKAQSDDADWLKTTETIAQAAMAARAAAQSEDATAAKAALAELAAGNAAMTKLQPSGQPLPPPKANLRSLMLLMDTVRGEAKIALIACKPESAKNQAYVLSELGRVVSNLRSGDRWSKMSEEFTAASVAAARSTSAEAADLRPLFKVVSQRCDACHDTR